MDTGFGRAFRARHGDILRSPERSEASPIQPILAPWPFTEPRKHHAQRVPHSKLPSPEAQSPIAVVNQTTGGVHRSRFAGQVGGFEAEQRPRRDPSGVRS
jgi:hypothetical protein